MYSIEIKATSTGMVIASVYRDDTRIGLEFYDGGIFNTPAAIKKRLAKAKVWATAYMNECKKGEII